MRLALTQCDVSRQAILTTLLIGLALNQGLACNSRVFGWEPLDDEGGEELESLPDAGSPDPIDEPDAQPAFVALTISGISVANGKTYPLISEGATVGIERYIDRDYTITEIPAIVAGIPFLRTSNTDANTTALSHIEFEINKPAIIYVAHDDRKSTKPAWMAVFIDTGADLRDSDSSSGKFSVYAAEMPAGTVTLGGNIAGGQEESMYSVFIADAELL